MPDTNLCTACGAEMQADFQFCPRCGQAMPPLRPLQPQTPFASIEVSPPSAAPPIPEELVLASPAEPDLPQQEGAEGAFAKSLPGWDLLPPNAPVLHKGEL